MADNNTIGMLQTIGNVGSGANVGRLNLVDAPFLDTYIKRIGKVTNILASAINANGGNLDVSLTRTFNITMDANIATLNLIGLDDVKAVNPDQTQVPADGWATIINFIQGGVGNFTCGLGTSFIFNNVFNSIVLSGTVGKRDKLGVTFAEDLNKYEALEFLKGYN